MHDMKKRILSLLLAIVTVYRPGCTERDQLSVFPCRFQLISFARFEPQERRLGLSPSRRRSLAVYPDVAAHNSTERNHSKALPLMKLPPATCTIPQYVDCPSQL